MIAVGIIGAGKHGLKLLSSFSKVSNVVAVANKHDVSKIGREYPTLKTTLDYHDILSDPAVEAVVIATPHSELFHIARESLNAGKHVFVEKPMAANYEDGDSLIRDYYRNHYPKQILFVGYQTAYSPQYEALKTSLFSDPVVCIDSVWFKWGTFGNDILLNLLSHELFTCLDLIGKYPVDFKVIDYSDNSIQIELFFEGGVSSLITIYRESDIRYRRVNVFTENNKFMTLLEDPNSLDIECRKFTQSIETGQNLSAGLLTACDVLKIIDSIKSQCELPKSSAYPIN